MKTLIPLLSLLCGSFAVQNCSDEDQEFQNQPEIVQVTTKDDSVSNSNRRDSTKSENYKLYPDPPVKDTHDWRTNP